MENPPHRYLDIMEINAAVEKKECFTKLNCRISQLDNNQEPANALIKIVAGFHPLATHQKNTSVSYSTFLMLFFLRHLTFLITQELPLLLRQPEIP
jgi:hypothetical protein